MTYSEFVSVFSVIERETRTRCIILSSMALSGSTIFFFFALSHKRHNFRENITEHKMCFEFIYILVKKNSHSRTNQRVIITKVNRFACKVSVILVRF